jgi:Tfp pilus assembly protein PilO
MERGSWAITLPVAAATIAYLFFVFLPTRRDIESLRLQVQQKQDVISAAEPLRAIIASMEHEAEVAEQHVAAWRNQASSDSNLSTVYGEIHRRLEAAGAQADRFDPLEAADRRTLCEHRVALGTTGAFGEILDVFTRLEALPQTIWLEDVRLEATPQARQGIQCEATLVIFTDNSEDSN